MANVALILVFGSVLILTIVNEVLIHRARKARLRSLNSRKITAMEEWFANHMESRGVSFIAAEIIATHLAESLGCHPSQFRPEDSFKGFLSIANCSLFGVDDDAEIEAFECSLADKIGSDIVNRISEEIGAVKTFGDLVVLYDQHVSSCPPATTNNS
jgi:hypothetical protein